MLKTLALLLLAGIIAAQTTPKEEATQPYTDSEAYAVYSAIIQNGWATLSHEPELFISDQTVVIHNVSLKPEGDLQATLGPAIADYQEANQEQRSLRREFHIDKPYDLVTADKTSKPFWIRFSSVGFNGDKTVAVVAVDRVIAHVGGSSGSGSFVVLFKKDGKWQRGKWSGADCAWIGSVGTGS